MGRENVRMVREWIEQARRQGWVVTKPLRGGHWRFRAPDGRTAIVPSTPGGGRAMQNTRALLRRTGLEIR